MGRPKRADEAGCIYHMLNRANRRDKLFFKDADYEAFERVLTEAVARHQLVVFFLSCPITGIFACVRVSMARCPGSPNGSR
jgi:REP element-mobilizing transposase RayT